MYIVLFEHFGSNLLTGRNGKPIVFYHGTSKIAAESIRNNGFNPGFGRFGTTTISFTSIEKYAKPYDKGGMIRAHISMNKPMNFNKNFEIREEVIKNLTGKTIKQMNTADWRKYTGEISKQFLIRAKEKGYDGVYDPTQPEIVVFDVKDIHIID